jgi:hypothetical protein
MKPNSNKRQTRINIGYVRLLLAILRAAPLLLLMCVTAHSEDFGTINRRSYNGVLVTRWEPDGVMVRTKYGISKIYFCEMTEQLHAKYHYNPEAAQQYAATERQAIDDYNTQLVAAEEKAAQVERQFQIDMANSAAAQAQALALLQATTATPQQLTINVQVNNVSYAQPVTFWRPLWYPIRHNVGFVGRNW